MILLCIIHCNEINFASRLCDIIVVDFKSHVVSDYPLMLSEGDYQTNDWVDDDDGLISSKEINK